MKTLSLSQPSRRAYKGLWAQIWNGITYHPCMDGHIKRTNQVLKNMLDYRMSWVEIVPKKVQVQK